MGFAFGVMGLYVGTMLGANAEAADGGAGRKANRLIKEKSPYLLQHAYNPVDWYPWGEEAFEAGGCWGCSAITGEAAMVDMAGRELSFAIQHTLANLRCVCDDFAFVDGLSGFVVMSEQFG